MEALDAGRVPSSDAELMAEVRAEARLWSNSMERQKAEELADELRRHSVVISQLTVAQEASIGQNKGSVRVSRSSLPQVLCLSLSAIDAVEAEGGALPPAPVYLTILAVPQKQAVVVPCIGSGGFNLDTHLPMRLSARAPYTPATALFYITRSTSDEEVFGRDVNRDNVASGCDRGKFSFATLDFTDGGPVLVVTEDVCEWMADVVKEDLAYVLHKRAQAPDLVGILHVSRYVQPPEPTSVTFIRFPRKREEPPAGDSGGDGEEGEERAAEEAEETAASVARPTSATAAAADDDAAAAAAEERKAEEKEEELREREEELRENIRKILDDDDDDDDDDGKTRRRRRREQQQQQKELPPPPDSPPQSPSSSISMSPLHQQQAEADLRAMELTPSPDPPVSPLPNDDDDDDERRLLPPNAESSTDKEEEEEQTRAKEEEDQTRAKEEPAPGAVLALDGAKGEGGAAAEAAVVVEEEVVEEMYAHVVVPLSLASTTTNLPLAAVVTPLPDMAVPVPLVLRPPPPAAAAREGGDGAETPATEEEQRQQEPSPDEQQREPSPDEQQQPSPDEQQQQQQQQQPSLDEQPPQEEERPQEGAERSLEARGEKAAEQQQPAPKKEDEDGERVLVGDIRTGSVTSEPAFIASAQSVLKRLLDDDADDDDPPQELTIYLYNPLLVKGQKSEEEEEDEAEDDEEWNEDEDAKIQKSIDEALQITTERLTSNPHRPVKYTFKASSKRVVARRRKLMRSCMQEFRERFPDIFCLRELSDDVDEEKRWPGVVFEVVREGEWGREAAAPKEGVNDSPSGVAAPKEEAAPEEEDDDDDDDDEPPAEEEEARGGARCTFLCGTSDEDRDESPPPPSALATAIKEEEEEKRRWWKIKKEEVEEADDVFDDPFNGLTPFISQDSTGYLKKVTAMDDAEEAVLRLPTELVAEVAGESTTRTTMTRLEAHALLQCTNKLYATHPTKWLITTEIREVGSSWRANWKLQVFETKSRAMLAWHTYYTLTVAMGRTYAELLVIYATNYYVYRNMEEEQNLQHLMRAFNAHAFKVCRRLVEQAARKCKSPKKGGGGKSLMTKSTSALTTMAVGDEEEAGAGSKMFVCLSIPSGYRKNLVMECENIEMILRVKKKKGKGGAAGGGGAAKGGGAAAQSFVHMLTEYAATIEMAPEDARVFAFLWQKRAEARKRRHRLLNQMRCNAESLRNSGTLRSAAAAAMGKTPPAAGEAADEAADEAKTRAEMVASIKRRAASFTDAVGVMVAQLGPEFCRVETELATYQRLFDEMLREERAENERRKMAEQQQQRREAELAEQQQQRREAELAEAATTTVGSSSDAVVL